MSQLTLTKLSFYIFAEIGSTLSSLFGSSKGEEEKKDEKSKEEEQKQVKLIRSFHIVIHHIYRNSHFITR